MFVIALYLWTLILVVRGDTTQSNDTIINVTASNDTSSTCASEFQYADNNEPINVTESCNKKSPCISKCCPSNKTLVLDRAEDSLSCVDNINLTLTYKSLDLAKLNDFSDVTFYKNNVDQNQIKSSKRIDDFIQIYSYDFISEDCFIDIEPYFPPPPAEPAHTIYFLENGSLVIRELNVFKQWTIEMPPDKFCVGHQIDLDNGTISNPELVIRMSVSNFGDEIPATKNIIFAYGMLVSCVFLVLVLVAYALLPQLRNMAGLMLMAYVATLIAGFLLRAVQILAQNYGPLEKPTCVWLGLLTNYTLVASFTWMNVMSFDIWWSMRGFRKLRQIHRRGIIVKLGWYSLYGWGAPLTPVLFSIIVENLDLSHLPNFVRPHYTNPDLCFMDAGELLLYMDGPIFITTFINIMLFVMTAYNIWRIKQGVFQHSAGNSRRNRQDETRFGFYLKLSLVMGINWILEIVGTLCDSNSWWWCAPDVFNTLTGLFVFIIFICKRSTIVLLSKRLSIGQEVVQKWNVDSKCTESSRLNDKSSKRKMLDSLTDMSDA